MDRLIILFVATVFSMGANSQIITPNLKIGKVKIVLSENLINQSMQHFQMKFIAQNGNRTQIEKFDEAYSVPKGKGCLQFYAYKNHSTQELYNWKKCQIEIKAKKTTTINLSLVNFKWKLSKVKVDIGPKLFFTFRSEDKLLVEHKGFDMNSLSRQIVILPHGAYNVQYLNVDSHMEKSFFTVNHDKEEYDITPEDLRGEIYIKRSKKVFSSPRYMNRYSGNVKELFFDFKRKPIVNSRQALHSPQLYHHNETEYPMLISRIVLPAHKDKHIIRAYPSNKADKEYLLNVNNIPVRLEVNSNSGTMVPLETLNIGLIDGEYKGDYQIRQKDLGLSNGERTLQYAITCDNLEEACAKLSKGLFFKTETSVEVPLGYQYVVDAFLKLSNGTRELQDQIEVDLR